MAARKPAAKKKAKEVKALPLWWLRQALAARGYEIVQKATRMVAGQPYGRRARDKQLAAQISREAY